MSKNRRKSTKLVHSPESHLVVLGPTPSEVAEATYALLVSRVGGLGALVTTAVMVDRVVVNSQSVTGWRNRPGKGQMVVMFSPALPYIVLPAAKIALLTRKELEHEMGLEKLNGGPAEPVVSTPLDTQGYL